MKDLTIFDVIKIIPLDKKYREGLLCDFEIYDEDLKLNIREICWKAFFEYKEALEDAKLELFLSEVSQEKRKLTGDMMTEVKKAVWQDMEDILNGKREEMERIRDLQSKIQSAIGQQKN